MSNQEITSLRIFCHWMDEEEEEELFRFFYLMLDFCTGDRPNHKEINYF